MWHRRARKTTTALIELVKQALFKKGAYWHIFPTYSEAKDAVWRDPNMLFRIIPKDLIARQNETELIVYLKNGSYIQLKGADDPDALRGAGPLGMIFDEWPFMKIEAWSIMEPVLRANGGWAWFVFTPKGKNHGWDFYNRGLSDNPEWRSWLLKASESNIISQHDLDEAKKTALNEGFYRQEWECDFLEGQGQIFKGVRDVMTALPEMPIEGHYYTIGCDLGKYKDYTVVSVADRSNNTMVYRDRFNQMEWPFIKKKIASIAKHYNNALVILDSTGLGDPIFDDLARNGTAVESYKFTEESKKDLIEKLSIWIEQKKLKLLKTEDALLEYDNYAYEILPSGRLRYGAPIGYHDDIVTADALMAWGLHDLYITKTDAPQTRLQAFRKIKESSYAEEEQNWKDFEAI